MTELLHRPSPRSTPRSVRAVAPPVGGMPVGASADLFTNVSPGVRVRLLGTVDVVANGAVHPVRGARRRTVLAALAIRCGDVVQVDRLVDLVWGERPPRTARNTLQAHVSYLRRVLGNGGAIRAESGGYRLDLGPGGTDAVVAERLVAACRPDDPQACVELCLAALALWRGRPLAGLVDTSWADAQAERLSQVQIQAHRLLADARLQLGGAGEVVRQLSTFTREHPLDEALAGCLMLALHHEGRAGEALEVYRRLRAGLRDELGLEPGPAVRRAHAAVLRREPPPAPPPAARRAFQH